MDNWYKITDHTIDFRYDLQYLNCHQAAELTINEVLINYPSPYYLMASGGIDSQFMLYFWKLYGKDYIPTTIMYDHTFNLHDYSTIIEFAKVQSLEINFINFDLLYFLQQEYDSYSEKFRCSSPCISAHIKMTEHLKGTVIFSGDFLGKNSACLTDAIMGLYRASLVRTTLIPYFFLHTPQLAYTFYENTNNHNLLHIKEYEKKVLRYKDLGVPIIPQKTKISGFEIVKDYYDKHFYHLVPKLNRLKYANKQSKRTFDLLYRYPYEEKYNDMDYKFITN